MMDVDVDLDRPAEDGTMDYEEDMGEPSAGIEIEADATLDEVLRDDEAMAVEPPMASGAVDVVVIEDEMGLNPQEGEGAGMEPEPTPIPGHIEGSDPFFPHRQVGEPIISGNPGGIVADVTDVRQAQPGAQSGAGRTTDDPPLGNNPFTATGQTTAAAPRELGSSDAYSAFQADPAGESSTSNTAAEPIVPASIAGRSHSSPAQAERKLELDQNGGYADGEDGLEAVSVKAIDAAGAAESSEDEEEYYEEEEEDGQVEQGAEAGVEGKDKAGNRDDKQITGQPLSGEIDTAPAEQSADLGHPEDPAVSPRQETSAAENDQDLEGETENETYDLDEMLTVHTLPDIIIHLPDQPPKSLFFALTPDAEGAQLPDGISAATPIWLEDRHEELAQVPLERLLAVIRTQVEVDKKGKRDGKEMILEERGLGLKLGEVSGVSFPLDEYRS